MAKRWDRSLPLPAAWPKRVRSAVIHTMSLAAAALTATRGRLSRHTSTRVRLRAENERLGQELALLREELRLKDARMSRVRGHERPHYPPVERLAILRLRAVRGWSAQQTANRFHLSPVTVSHWMRRLDEQGPDALIQAPVPLNKYPDFVAHIVQELKLLCPSFGYGRIAQLLCREGLHLGTSTISRLTRRSIAPEPAPEPIGEKRHRPVTRVIAEYPHHAWHCDLTLVPTSMGIWTSTRPHWLPACWPFCWWVAVLADQFSARIMRLAVFRTQPAPGEIRDLVARTMDEVGVVPECVITDMGPQFRDGRFRPWCRRAGARHLFGRIGQHGSIPFVERVIRTVKAECTTRILFPLSRTAARRELDLFRRWYNRVRPHQRLGGATPDERCRGLEPSVARSRLDPRAGDRFALRVRYLAGRRHLPIVALERAA